MSWLFGRQVPVPSSELADWQALWTFLDNKKFVFTCLEDYDNLFSSLHVSKLIERTRFIRAYRFAAAQSFFNPQLGYVLKRTPPRAKRYFPDALRREAEGVSFLITLRSQLGETSQYHLALLPTLDWIHLHPAACYFRVSSPGEDQDTFFRRELGSTSVDLFASWNLRHQPFNLQMFFRHAFDEWSPHRQRTSFYLASGLSNFTGACVEYSLSTLGYIRSPAPRGRASEQVTPTHAPIQVTSSTPLGQIIQYFREEQGLHECTNDLASISPEELGPVASSVFADIYRVTLLNGALVAVKCVRCLSDAPPHRELKLSARELKTWSSLKHPGILQLHGFGIFRGHLAMVSPWMRNRNVIRYLEHKPLVDRYLKCGELVQAVKYLHDLNVVHGDLKGANALVADDGKLKVADFGLTVMQQTVFEFSKTDPGGGSLQWMAPELLSETGARSKEGDIYALGMEITTGQVPFYNTSFGFATISNIINKALRPQKPHDTLSASPIGDKFWDVLEDCWLGPPEVRLNALEVEHELIRLGGFGLGPEAEPESGTTGQS